MAWYDAPITVPFGNPNYDVLYGGAHDMDVKAPPNEPITALLPGTVSSINTQVPWGEQIGIQLDTPWKGIAYMAYLHMAAVNPALRVGSRVRAGDIVGWAGGATSAAQYAGTSNPTGHNFVNDPSQSSQTQIGFALMRGPAYGIGAGWTQRPDPALDPTGILQAARGGTLGIPQTATEPAGAPGADVLSSIPNLPAIVGAAALVPLVLGLVLAAIVAGAAYLLLKG